MVSPAEPSGFAFHLFGLPQLRVDGQQAPPLRSRATLFLLALLVLRHPQPLERAWLAVTLWPDSGPVQGLANLRQRLAELRRVLGLAAPRLLSPSPRTLALAVEGADIDLLAFDALLQRIHPAESRVRKLAKETPATYVLFDLLVEDRSSLYERDLSVRRDRLATFVERNFAKNATIRLSPATSDAALARAWLEGSIARLDGVIAKRDVAYAFGRRDAAIKIKRSYTADCVVGGFRKSNDGAVASLLLGLYDDDGLLHHVGFVGSMSAAERRRAGELLFPIVEPPGFTGNAPGGVSRWNRGKESEWFPVRPQVVVEIAFDHTTARRFRHAARLLRWRPDKPPHQCTMEQLLNPTG